MHFIMETMMRNAEISFPMLGDLSLNPPSFFSLFGKNIYFYGVIIALGFILGSIYCGKNAKKFGIEEDDLYGLLIWLIPLCIIGARLYYVAFRWEYYAENPSEIMAIWNGGLAIYGGVIAGIITGVVYCRVHKIKIFAMLDLLVFGLLIGQILGRWGNFMNREAFGAVTDVFCRMGLTYPGGETIYVHPTFLYESLWNLIGFIVLLIFAKKNCRKFDGQFTLMYTLWYGLGRAWIEGLRTDSLYIGSTNIRVSQLLAIISAATALVLLIIGLKKKHSPEELFVNQKHEGSDSE